MSETIGSLRHRAVLEEKSRTSDGAGGFLETWVELATVWISIKTEKGSESQQADRTTSRNIYSIGMRYRDDVFPEMRIRKDDRVFEILSVVNFDEEDRWLECLCEERNL